MGRGGGESVGPAGGGERLGAAAGLVVCVVLAILALTLARPPAPRPGSAPATEFSAVRAQRHVEAIASVPHPPGTTAHRMAADYILREMRDLGLEPEVQEGWSATGGGARVSAVKIRNLMVRIPGTGDGPALLVATHYDSVPTSPGAGDDGVGVAASLEMLRALLTGPTLSNDLIVLVTDGEESGLLGARLFVEEHEWADDVGAVLNFEARGNRGLVNMFETSVGGGALVRAMAASSPHPFASSVSYEVYRRMPNDTDLSVFLDVALPGLNFAMIGNHSAHHTELDTPQALDPASLQHHGSHMLALSRHLGETDLGALELEDTVYFNPLGSWLLVYSNLIGRVLAVVAAFALIGVIVRRGRPDRLQWAGMRGGVWAWFGVTIAGPLATALVWSLFSRAFPQALVSPYGEPYAADWIKLAALLVCLSVVTFVASLFASAPGGELLAGILVPWVVIGWLLSLLIPGAGYLMVWPALAGIGGLLLFLVVPSPWLKGMALTLGAAFAMLIFAPIAVLVTDALQVNSALVMGAVLTLPLSLALPAIRVLVAGRQWPTGLLTVAGLGLMFWVGISARPTAATPESTSLFYLLDMEAEEAWWMSYEAAADEWTRQVIADDVQPSAYPGFLPARPGAEALRAPAPVVEVPGPEAELVDDRFEDDMRRLRLRIRSPRGAENLLLVPDPAMATILAVGVDGSMIDLDDAAAQVSLTLQNVPPEGVVVTIQTLDRQPLSIDLVDWSYGLDEVGGDLAPRPAHLIRRTRWLTDSLLVRRTFWF